MPDRQDPLIGSMLGKDYRVLERIGAGGMAIVYLIEHQTLLKQFAAKVLSQELASSLEARARFTQEAHAASQLDHENIITISDFGVTADHRPFFVMELLRGKTLDQRLAEGRMTLEEVVAVCVPVARALSHAHAEGIVHLDVKPENIFLVQRSQGRLGVKVVDFGIAKTPLNPRLTKIGETNGSPLFMAPETVRGDEDVDLRADIYSFGILLYLMMCGRLPFVDTSMQRVLQMQLVQLPAPPREVNSELSPELAAIVERALAKNREDRYPSMESLLLDLAAALPEGSDRLLIEAQSGVASHDTPFSGTMALPRAESQREPRASLPPPMFRSMLPRAPSRRRPLIIATAAIVTSVVGVATWRELATAPQATASPAAVMPPRIEEITHGDDHRRVRTLGDQDPPAGDSPRGDDHAPEHIPVPEPPPEAPPTPLPVAAAGSPAPTSDEAEQPIGERVAIAVPERVAAQPPPAAPQKTGRRTTRSASNPPKPARAIQRPVRRGAPAVALAPSPVPVTPASEAPPPAAAVAEPNPEPAPPASPAQDTARPEAPPAQDPVTPAPQVMPPPPPRPTPTPPRPPTTPPPGPRSPGSIEAIASIANLDVKGPLPAVVVRRGVERALPSLRGCYQSAARAGNAPPALDVTLSFEIDENRLATRVTTPGASAGPLGGCVAAAASRIRTQEAPDTGTAQVTVVIRFRSN